VIEQPRREVREATTEPGVADHDADRHGAAERVKRPQLLVRRVPEQDQVVEHRLAHDRERAAGEQEGKGWTAPALGGSPPPDDDSKRERRHQDRVDHERRVAGRMDRHLYESKGLHGSTIP
jgi:hypothetical protein